MLFCPSTPSRGISGPSPFFQGLPPTGYFVLGFPTSSSWVREHCLYFNFALFLLKLMITPSVFCYHLYFVLCLVDQSYPTLCDPMYFSPLGSSVHGDNPGKKTGMAMHFSRGYSQPWDGTQVSHTACRSLLSEPPEALYSHQKQDQELTVAQIMNSLLPNSDVN